MRVETVAQTSPGSWTLGLVGTRSERFRKVSLGAAELAGPAGHLPGMAPPAQLPWARILQRRAPRARGDEARKFFRPATAAALPPRAPARAGMNPGKKLDGTGRLHVAFAPTPTHPRPAAWPDPVGPCIRVSRPDWALSKARSFLGADAKVYGSGRTEYPCCQVRSPRCVWKLMQRRAVPLRWMASCPVLAALAAKCGPVRAARWRGRAACA